MVRYITTLAELTERPPRHLLLLYSGGADGTYLLRRLCDQGIHLTALSVLIGKNEVDRTRAARNAEQAGAKFREVDATREFFSDYLPAAIHADAFYQGQFPVGSTITRPLMARMAVDIARELGCDAVGHTATYMQNSSLRISASVSALAPDLDVVAPFLGSDVPRDEKIAYLSAAGITFTTGVHSVDANPWSRVIECGSLESPENRLDESVFLLTRDISDAPEEALEMELRFAAGLPVSVDGADKRLEDIVEELNVLAGRHGVGRFSGLEDTPFGVKNHEIRESPAAAVLTTAHRALANAVFTTREHTVRSQLATEWTNTVVHGGWFGHLAQCLARCLAELDAPVSGSVRLRLHRGTVQVLRLESANGLYYSRFDRQYHVWMNASNFGPWLTLATLPDTTRNDTAAKDRSHT